MPEPHESPVLVTFHSCTCHRESPIGLVFGLTANVLPQVTGDVFYARTWDNYKNLNSLSGATGFAFRRMDGVDRISAQLTWEFFEWLKVYARYDHISADSNIIFFDYGQNSYSGGLVFLLPSIP